RHAAGRGVRVREQAEPLQLGELAANGRRRDVEPDARDERPRPDRLPARDVLLDDTAQDRPLAPRQIRLADVPAHSQGFYASSSPVTPPPRKRPRWVSASSSPSPERETSPSRSSRSTASASTAASSPASESGSSRRNPSSTRSDRRTGAGSSSTSRSGRSPARGDAR